jgi:hypothetical protein
MEASPSGLNRAYRPGDRAHSPLAADVPGERLAYIQG